MIVIFKLPYVTSYTLLFKEFITNQSGGKKEKKGHSTCFVVLISASKMTQSQKRADGVSTSPPVTHTKIAGS